MNYLLQEEYMPILKIIKEVLFDGKNVREGVEEIFRNRELM